MKKIYTTRDDNTAHEFKARCAEYGTPMCEILDESIDAFLRTHPKKFPPKSLVE
jgi:hypothetical protein